jgi:hypothetical protein
MFRREREPMAGTDPCPYKVEPQRHDPGQARAGLEGEVGICSWCGADRKAYLEMMHRPCSEEHGIGAGWRGQVICADCGRYESECVCPEVRR